MSLDPTWPSQLAVHWLACLPVMTCTVDSCLCVIRDGWLGDWAMIRIFFLFFDVKICYDLVILFWDNRTKLEVPSGILKKIPLFYEKMKKEKRSKINYVQ